MTYLRNRAPENTKLVLVDGTCLDGLYHIFGFLENLEISDFKVT